MNLFNLIPKSSAVEAAVKDPAVCGSVTDDLPRLMSLRYPRTNFHRRCKSLVTVAVWYPILIFTLLLLDQVMGRNVLNS